MSRFVHKCARRAALGAALFRGGVGLGLCLSLVACAQVEFSGPERRYTIDKQESDNEMHLNELSKIKKDPTHWGTLHFSSSNPEKKDITVDIGKEKFDYRPSRYFATTNLPEIDGKTLGFTLSVDNKHDAWMGLQFKLKTDFWSPAGALK